MKKILCLDFDGVIHRYDSGWKGASVVSDWIVDGAVEFIMAAQEAGWKVMIFSSRSNQPGGKAAMQEWLLGHFSTGVKLPATLSEIEDHLAARYSAFDKIDWPTEKPPATVTIDDRAITFEGKWPSLDFLNDFKPWNKR